MKHINRKWLLSNAPEGYSERFDKRQKLVMGALEIHSYAKDGYHPPYFYGLPSFPYLSSK